MPIESKETKVEIPVHVIRISGRMSESSDEELQFAGACNQLTQDSAAKHIIIDLSACFIQGNAGFGEMIQLLDKVTNRGGRVHLVIVPEGLVMQKISLCNLHTIFPVFPTENDALKAFK